MHKKKEIILLLSNKPNPIGGKLIRNQEANKVLDICFICKPNIEKRETTHANVYKNGFSLKLSSISEENLIHNESIPVQSADDEPLISCLSYDDNLFKESVTLGNVYSNNEKTNRNCINILHEYIGNDHDEKLQTRNSSCVYETLFHYINLHFILKSEKLQWLHSFLQRLHWYTHFTSEMSAFSTNCQQENKKKAIITKNLLSAKVFDFILGVIALYFVLEHKSNIWETILHSTKYVIDELKNLLEILMGSPAGLKLNCALNHTLGIFFFYHISLWKAFIESIVIVSSSILYGFVILGSLGLSYQIALCADVIMFLTFHVYCIYVYAARLYRVQMYAITSLWRLFIGRKHNPLKNRVDSFQYSHNQLFVGTLGFTVLLFLLPTTFMYYIVFTLFRIVVLLVCKVMFRIANMLSAIPLYLLFLRLIGSSRIKGSIRIYATTNEANSTLKLHASLDSLGSWFQNDNAITVEANGRPLNEYVNSICTGKLF